VLLKTGGRRIKHTKKMHLTKSRPKGRLVLHHFKVVRLEGFGETNNQTVFMTFWVSPIIFLSSTTKDSRSSHSISQIVIGTHSKVVMSTIALIAISQNKANTELVVDRLAEGQRVTLISLIDIFGEAMSNFECGNTVTH
jgi:hypothetical protein